MNETPNTRISYCCWWCVCRQCQPYERIVWEYFIRIEWKLLGGKEITTTTTTIPLAMYILHDTAASHAIVCLVACAFSKKKCVECKIIARRSIFKHGDVKQNSTNDWRMIRCSSFLLHSLAFDLFCHRFICRLQPLSSSSCINCAIVLYILRWCGRRVATAAKCSICDRSVHAWSAIFSQTNKRKHNGIVRPNKSPECQLQFSLAVRGISRVIQCMVGFRNLFDCVRSNVDIASKFEPIERLIDRPSDQVTHGW